MAYFKIVELIFFWISVCISPIRHDAHMLLLDVVRCPKLPPFLSAWSWARRQAKRWAGSLERRVRRLSEVNFPCDAHIRHPHVVLWGAVTFGGATSARVLCRSLLPQVLSPEFIPDVRRWFSAIRKSPARDGM